MAIENVQQLLTEQLGKHRCDVITTTAMSGKDYYAIHFVTESVIASIAASNIQTGTGSAAAAFVLAFAGAAASSAASPSSPLEALPGRPCQGEGEWPIGHGARDD